MKQVWVCITSFIVYAKQLMDLSALRLLGRLCVICFVDLEKDALNPQDFEPHRRMILTPFEEAERACRFLSVLTDSN